MTRVVNATNPCESKPIYLAVNQSSILATWRMYKKRRWIEEIFDDMTGHGFDLEHSRLKHVDRLNRPMLVVSLVYI